MIDRVLGHYRIVAKLGQGGMGVVYRARDEVLQRDVALKFVGETLAREARQFLLREARAASALSHPNICTVHEVSEAGGEFYIVMELIEGKPLSASIVTGGLASESVMRYGVQIAGALTHAHGRNLVHRDLKSANIMVTPEGLVKVLDFGLARRLAAEAPVEGTRTMETMEAAVSTGGTLSYMSPETLRGEPGDYRSDIWALGVVLYEAAAGEVPFHGRTTFEVSSAILHDPPPPLPARIPPGLAAIIQRCLAKEPAQRYQRASEVRAALEAIQAASAVAGPPGDQRGPRTTVHRGIKHLTVRNGDVLLLAGTMKGVFLLRSAVGAVQAPMVLQEEAFRARGVHHHLVNALAVELRILLRHVHHANAAVARLPGAPAVFGGVDAACRNGHVHPLRILRIEHNGVQGQAAQSGHPAGAVRMVVQAPHQGERFAVVARFVERRRLHPAIHDVRLPPGVPGKSARCSSGWRPSRPET
ncbi:MAG: serine/threonine protein kinase [Acidobacteriia bacterium]|nr:serine/threonine protein kinase [Terriglobia bacterium]